MQAEIGDKKVVERRLLQRVTHRDVHTCFGLYSLQYGDEQILIGDDEGGFFQCFGRRVFEQFGYTMRLIDAFGYSREIEFFFFFVIALYELRFMSLVIAPTVSIFAQEEPCIVSRVVQKISIAIPINFTAYIH